MPLKPIFEKAPLIAAHALPLRPGQVQAENHTIRTLLASLTPEEMQHTPTLWEGLFRCKAMLSATPEALPVESWINDALCQQGEDGRLPGSPEESVALARAALALYESNPARSTLERLIQWCAYLSKNLDALLEASVTFRQRPADWMELLEQLYRVTGKKGLLSLCDQLRRRCMDWSGLLHTFAVQRPMNRVTPWSDMEAGLEAEGGNEQGFYTRQYLTCHGESLADGARAAAMNGVYSGNGTELSATQMGWQRMVRYHGAVCGGLTCDETLAGASPSGAVDAAALGAWAEAMCVSADVEHPLWDALEIMLENALPKTVLDGQLHTLQRVNGLRAAGSTAGTYHLGENREVRAVSRLLRGYAAAYSHAVTARKTGLDVNLYLPGRYTAAVDGQVISLTLAGQQDRFTLSLRVKQPVRAVLRLRIPTWAEGASVTVNQEEPASPSAGTELVLERMWQNGDTITCVYPRTPRTLDGHHQSRYVRLGSTLLLMPVAADAPWNMAMLDDAHLDPQGRVVCTVAPVPDWRKRGDVPADLPVLPKVTGDAHEVALVPYASACGIALFPKGTRV